MNNFPPEIHAYTPVCLCGRGAYGSVWLVTDAIGEKYALKIVFKSSLGGEWKREFNGLRYYRNHVTPHPNLIRIHHLEDYPDFFYYTMECADNLSPDDGDYRPATLADLINMNGALPPAETVKIFDRLLDALAHLHLSGLIHRDIKPDNVVFIGGVPKLGDIGLVSSATHTLSLAGTREFIPPEYLTGQKKEATETIDLYALGKTLYCAFSGQSPGDFPLIPPPVLREPANRLFNQLAKRACAAEPIVRLKTIHEFRAALHGSIGWKYEFQYLFLRLFRLIRLPFSWLRRLIAVPAVRRWSLTVAVLLAVLWFGMFLKTFLQLEKLHHPYDFGIHADTLKLALFNWHVQFGNYDLYDFYKKNDFRLKLYGNKRLVTREEYLREKNPGLPPQPLALEFEIDEPDAAGKRVKQLFRYPAPEVTQNTPLQEEYLHELFFRELHSRKLEVPTDTEWQQKIMYLPASRSARLKFTEELPLYSEINISFNPYRFDGEMAILLTAAEYVPVSGPPPPEERIRRQLRFRMVSDGEKLSFQPALYREQDCFEDELREAATPAIREISLEDRFYQLSIVLADNCRRVYLDGNLIWVTYPAFYGGYLDMSYRSTSRHPLQINDFSIYDTGLVQPDDPRQSRLMLPERRALSEPDENLRKFQWLDALFPRELLPMPRLFSDLGYGATESSGSTVQGRKISLTAGRTFLFLHRRFSKPWELNFTVVFHDDQSRLEIHPYAVFDDGDTPRLGVISSRFTVRSSAMFSSPPCQVDFVLRCETGTMELTGKSGGIEVYRSSFFIPEAGLFHLGLNCDVKTGLEILLPPEDDFPGRGRR